MLDQLKTDVTAFCKTLPIFDRFSFVGVECSGGESSPTLRVFVDVPGGITLDQCAEVSAALDLPLEEFLSSTPVAASYTLEVSSPGVDRPLFEREDFEQFAGKYVVLKTKRPVGNRKTFRAKLTGFDRTADHILLHFEGKDASVPFIDMAKANIDYFRTDTKK